MISKWIVSEIGIDALAEIPVSAHRPETGQVEAVIEVAILPDSRRPGAGCTERSRSRRLPYVRESDWLGGRSVGTRRARTGH